MRLAPHLLCSTALAAMPLAWAHLSQEPVLAAPMVQPAAKLPESPSRSSARYALTPERRALLATIRYAEGTWLEGRPEGYRILYGGGSFQDVSRHPDVVVVNRYASAAAGAYQFMPDTWASASGALSLKGFGPANQDQAALYLVDRSGALEALDRGRFDGEVIARLAPIWASFPTQSGASAYGQPVKGQRELVAFFDRHLQQSRTAT